MKSYSIITFGPSVTLPSAPADYDHLCYDPSDGSEKPGKNLNILVDRVTTPWILLLADGLILEDLPDRSTLDDLDDCGLVGISGRTALNEHLHGVTRKGGGAAVQVRKTQTVETIAWAVKSELLRDHRFDESLSTRFLLAEELSLSLIKAGFINYVAPLPVNYGTYAEPPQGSYYRDILLIQQKWSSSISPVFIGDFSLIQVQKQSPRKATAKVKTIFASCNSFVVPREIERTVGLNQANKSFFSALIRENFFDEYHFFFDNPEISEQFHQHIAKSIDQSLVAKIRVFDRLELPDALAIHPYFVFHQSDPYIAPLINIRERYATNSFPITGVTHTISDVKTMSEYTAIALAPVLPCDRIICTSSGAEKMLGDLFNRIHQRVSGDRITLTRIPLGVDPMSFIPRDRRSYRSALNLPEEGIIILSLARLSPQTKMDLVPLLNVLFAMKERRGLEGIKIIIGGSCHDDNYLSTLRSTIAALKLDQEVSLIPNINEEAKTYLYNAADIFISLSDNIQETFGLTILEALSSGLPVIASDWDGYRDLIVDGEDGYLVPTYWDTSLARYEDLVPISSKAHFVFPQNTVVDMEVFLDRLETLIDDSPLRERMGLSGRRKVERQFSWISVARRYLDCWDDLQKYATRVVEGQRRSSIMPLFELFSHYSTGMIDDSSRVELTEYGRTLVERGIEIDAYSEIRELLSIGIIDSILASEGHTIEQILGGSAVDKAKIRFNLVWLWKNHLIRVRKT